MNRSVIILIFLAAAVIKISKGDHELSCFLFSLCVFNPQTLAKLTSGVSSHELTQHKNNGQVCRYVLSRPRAEVPHTVCLCLVATFRV